MALRIPPSRLQVWAVEDTRVQLTWGDLPAGEVTAWTGDVRASVEHPGGPGALDVGPLTPGTDHRIDVLHGAGRDQVVARTLTPPPGELLCRIATVSDLHLGATRWGLTHTMQDRSGLEPSFPMRCAKAAVDEASEWGAELLVVKGDAAHHQRADDFRQVGDLLDSIPELPVLLIPGNHEVDGHSDDPMPAKVGRRGIPYLTEPACVDLRGLRVIVADTTVAGQGSGSLERIAADVVELAALGTTPFFLGLHHQVQRRRLPDHYPLGVPNREGMSFLADLARANPRGFVSSGHTHRNRARNHGPLGISEVASTRDWPGVWAGYAVHEGGIRQVVRRAAATQAISWHEYSRHALLGIWGWWSAGPIGQRCLTHQWTRS